jgi:hypothetical protein
MTLDDFRAIRAAKQKAWNEKRAKLQEVKDRIAALHEEFYDVLAHEAAAHQEYRDAVELFRTARDFKSKSVDEARMIMKLRGQA